MKIQNRFWKLYDFSSIFCILYCKAKQSFISGIGRPCAQMQPTTCFCIASKLRMIFTFSNHWKKKRRIHDTWNSSENQMSISKNEIVLKTTTLICLCIFCGCFHDTTKWSSCYRNGTACSAKMIYFLAFSRAS